MIEQKQQYGMTKEEYLATGEFEVPFDNILALAHRLEQRREEMGLTQEQVKEATGLSQQYISIAERPRPNSGARLIPMLRLVKFYGIEPNEVARILGLL